MRGRRPASKVSEPTPVPSRSTPLFALVAASWSHGGHGVAGAAAQRASRQRGRACHRKHAAARACRVAASWPRLCARRGASAAPRLTGVVGELWPTHGIRQRLAKTASQRLASLRRVTAGRCRSRRAPRPRRDGAACRAARHRSGAQPDGAQLPGGNAHQLRRLRCFPPAAFPAAARLPARPLLRLLHHHVRKPPLAQPWQRSAQGEHAPPSRCPWQCSAQRSPCARSAPLTRPCSAL